MSGLTTIPGRSDQATHPDSRHAVVCRCKRARHVHGTRSMHDAHRCRCTRCRVASAHARAESRRGRSYSDGLMLDRVGTRRRIEALHAVGWSGGELAERLGTTVQAVHSMRTRSSAIMPAVAERVAVLYDELWDQEPPGSRSVGSQTAKVRNWARRCGFVPPLAWDDEAIDDPAARPQIDGTAPNAPDVGVDLPGHGSGPQTAVEPLDEVAVERLMAGTLRMPSKTGPAGGTPPEMVEAIRRLAAAGMPDVEIGDRVGKRGDAVCKIRERYGIGAAARPAAVLPRRTTGRAA